MKEIEWLANQLENIDFFSYDLENSLVFNKKKSYSTYPGIMQTIMLIVSFGTLWYGQLYQMVYF